MSVQKNQNIVRPADIDYMPGLLRSFAILMRLRGKPVSEQSLLAGLAGSRVSPTACLASARKAGLSGCIMSRPKLEEISPLVLPCILLLKDDQSCVLLSIDDNQAHIIIPELQNSTQKVSLDELQKNYRGYAIFASVPSAPEKRIDAPSFSPGKRWFWDVIKYYAPIYKHVALASIVINLIAVASPLFVMNVYDRVIPNNATVTLWVLAVGIAVIYIFNFLLSTLRTHFVDMAGRNADVVLSSLLFEKIVSMRLDNKPESTGALVNNLREFEQVREFFSSSSLLACIDLPFLFVFILLIAYIAGPMALLPIAAIPVMLLAGFYFQYRLKKSSEASYRQNMQKNALLVETVNGLETLKCCAAESRMQRLWESICGLSADSSSQSRKYSHLAIAFSSFTTQMVTVLMVIWGAYRIGDGLMSMGGLIGCNILVGRAMAPLMQMASLFSKLQNSRIALKGLDMLMQIPSEDSADCMDYGDLEPTFELEKVSFSYPGSNTLALDNVSLTIKAGEKVGIIGKMGSGKSTLARMLLGLYQPKSGKVKMGGVDIQQIPKSDIRMRVGTLLQDVYLYYGSVRDNISLGDPSINNQLILRAANIAGVTDFIRHNPAGFAAQVGEQGKAFSGGQKQAIALARALVRDPEVLLLDEPTSNMDTASERELQKRLQSILKDRTLILITHRMSMLKMVDRIIVIDNGVIVMDGSKAEVLKKASEKIAGGATNG